MESYINTMPTFGDLSNVSVEKLQELNSVLAKILALPIAQDTYAQIIDGKPTRTPYSDQNKASQSRSGKINSISGTSKPSDQAIQEYEKIRKAFAPENLFIDLKVRGPFMLFRPSRLNSIQLAQEYQNAPSCSREHHLQLLRIAAASVNALARKTFRIFTQISTSSLRNRHKGINISSKELMNSMSTSITQAIGNSNDTHSVYWMLWAIGPRPNFLAVLYCSSVMTQAATFVAVKSGTVLCNSPKTKSSISQA